MSQIVFAHTVGWPPPFFFALGLKRQSNPLNGGLRSIAQGHVATVYGGPVCECATQMDGWKRRTFLMGGSSGFPAWISARTQLNGRMDQGVRTGSYLSYLSRSFFHHR